MNMLESCFYLRHYRLRTLCVGCLLVLWSLHVHGQMTYFVASLTLDSARTYVIQGTSFTQGTISSIPIGGSISPEGFLLPVLLLVVIIVKVKRMNSTKTGHHRLKYRSILSLLVSSRHSGDNDANDGDDDEREISWFYETSEVLRDPTIGIRAKGGFVSDLCG
ncbi:hypothetical protein Tco_0089359 [Tanacetum coccineum]